MRTFLIVGSLVAGTGLLPVKFGARASTICAPNALCACMESPIDIMVRRAPVAFVGKVVATATDTSDRTRRNIHVRVLYGWQGDPPDSLVVVDEHATSDCALYLPRDSTVLLLIGPHEDGKWRVTTCPHTVGVASGRTRALAALGTPRYSRAAD